MLVVIVVSLLITSITSDGALYTVPEPQIEIFPQGFRVSIPDDSGIELFAFHGNINVAMNGLEAGEFSKDILKKCNGVWIFEDVTKKLHEGDVLYFWLYVIKNGLGHRYDDGEFVVKDLKPFQAVDCNRTVQQECSTCNNWVFGAERDRHAHDPLIDVRISRPKRELSTCCQLFMNVSHRLVSLAERHDQLIKENEILFKLAGKDEYFATTLRLFGKYPTKYYPTAKDFVQNLIEEKLLLNDVKIIEAKPIPDNGVMFKLRSLNDKVKVILAAKQKLESSHYELLW
ncbi:hypothetical protein ABEB36_001374 [Hypothenemus hampei]|uniref:CBM39 domain-containing protein n=1 Tax=Hypothenemus hampei TaxID=57062 RepID=A0ABD1FEC2_HYPHA